MRSPASAAAAPAPRAATPPPKFIRPKFERMPVELKQLKNWVLLVPIRKDRSGQKAQSNRRDSAQAGATASAPTSASVRRSDVMHSRATDRRSASKCQGKWPDQTLEQAFGLPKVYTSRLSCKRAGKTRTLMPVGIHLGTLGLRLSAPRMQRSCAMRLCLKMSGGRILMRQLLVCFSILFLLGNSAYWARGDIAGTRVDNGSPTPSPSTSGDARGHSGDQSDIVGKLRSGGDKSSTDTTWSQGLTLGANGPIPVIVVDQCPLLPSPRACIPHSPAIRQAPIIIPVSSSGNGAPAAPPSAFAHQ